MLDDKDKYQWFKDNIDMYIIELSEMMKKERPSSKIILYLYSISRYLRDMYNNEDLRFLERFYGSFMERYHEDECSYKQKSIFRNRGYYSFFINLYIAMCGYIHHKDDFENFEAVMDDTFNEDIIYTTFNELVSNEKRVSSLMAMGEKVIERKNFKSMNNLRSLLRQIIVTYDKRCDMSVIFDKWKMLVDIDSSFYSLVDTSVQNVSFDNLDKIIEVMLSDEKRYYFSDTLLLGNRFFYLNERLYEIEDNIFMRENIFNEMCCLHPDLFFIDGVDKFDYYMDIVFDSDSYIELVNKLKILKSANDRYVFLGENVDKDLDSIRDIKDIYNNQMVVCPVDTNCLNVIKPKKIVDRMKKSYSYINDRMSYDFIDTLHSSSISLDDFLNIFNCTIVSYQSDEEEEKVITEKTKEKKKWFSFFGKK